jgi:MFS family permease
MITLGVYLIGSGLTALTLGNSAGWIVFLYITRFIAGMGIGGEYAAINSAIDELIPARFRGRVDIAVNGTYWAGAILGTLGTFIFLKTIDLSLGWRLAFLIGPVLGLVILFVRRHLPESPAPRDCLGDRVEQSGVEQHRADSEQKTRQYVRPGDHLPAADGVEEVPNSL